MPTKTTKEKITIHIPTKNRSDFLFRLLHYFADTKYQHWIFIGDSSNDFHLEETKKTIQSLKYKLKIKHFECPGASDAEAVAQMNQFVTTPYCAILPDDDFLCTNGINKCIDFLENNSDYGAAHGSGMGTLLTQVGGPYRSLSYLHCYEQTTLAAPSGSLRLRDYFAAGPYALLFSVHRTRDWQEMFQEPGFTTSPAPWARHEFIFIELIPSAVSSIRNKVKELDCLYLMRFFHQGIYSQIKAQDWLNSPDWSPGFKNLRDRLIDELIQQDGISKKEAEKVFKQAFQPFLDRVNLQAYQSSKGKSKGGALSFLVKKIDQQLPGFKKTCVRISTYLDERKKINLLPSLLKPTSPYYQDFLPIYRAITIPKNIQKK